MWSKNLGVWKAANSKVKLLFMSNLEAEIMHILY